MSSDYCVCSRRSAALPSATRWTLGPGSIRFIDLASLFCRVCLSRWNGTLMLSLDGFVDVDKYRYVYVMFFLALYVLILCSTCMIICLIWIHRNPCTFSLQLCRSTRFFSALRSTVVAVLSQQQRVSYYGCLVQVFFFYSLGRSDILLLLAMSYDRYVSICRPLQYASTMGTTCVSICLASAWFVPVCLMSLTVVVQSKQKICSVTLAAIICNATMMKIHCSLPFLAAWTLFILSVMAVFPVLFIFFTYFKIFMVAYHSQGEVWKKAVDTCLPHLIVLLATFSLMTFDIIIDLLESVLPKNVRLILTLQTLVFNPLLNPIIYGLKMTEIRKHINRLCCSHVGVIKTQVE